MPSSETTTTLLMDLVSAGDPQADASSRIAALKRQQKKMKKRRSSSLTSIDTAHTSTEEEEDEESQQQQEADAISELVLLQEPKTSSSVDLSCNAKEEGDDDDEEITCNSEVEAKDETVLTERLLKALSLERQQQSEQEREEPPSPTPKSVRFLQGGNHSQILYPEKLNPEELRLLKETSVSSFPASSPLTTENKVQRRVSFGHMNVHEFPCVLGDHPAVQSGGPPIRLEYSSSNDNECTTNDKNDSAAANPVYSYTLPVEDYEFNRPQRRTLPQLRIPADTRRQWMLSTETQQAVQKAERQVQKSQRQRAATRLLQEFEEWSLAHECVRRQGQKWWNRRKGNKSKRDENHVLAEEWNRRYKEQQRAAQRERLLQRQMLHKSESAAF